jgi:hypothetical protein
MSGSLLAADHLQGRDSQGVVVGALRYFRAGSEATMMLCSSLVPRSPFELVAARSCNNDNIVV